MSSNAITRESVQEILDRNRAGIKERQLEQYELDMIRQLNIHCADAKKDTASREWEEARRAERLEVQRKERELAEKGTRAVRLYLYSCVANLLLVGFTSFPWWAAVALTLGLAVFPVAYIYRLYVSLEVKT